MEQRSIKFDNMKDEFNRSCKKNRERKFRIMNRWGEWEYFPIPYNITGAGDLENCDPKTIGGYTGLKDKNRKEIYEGDIIKLDKDNRIEMDEDIISSVIFEDGAFVDSLTKSHIAWNSLKPMTEYATPNGNLWEVIGNIYQDEHLLK